MGFQSILKFGRRVIAWSVQAFSAKLVQPRKKDHFLRHFFVSGVFQMRLEV